jgi:tetratricopeptide (TPR) repeat protein
MSLRAISFACAALLYGMQASTTTKEDREAILARWREDFELDELERIVAEGPALVSGSGALAHDGEALALVARALFASGRETIAKNMLAAPVALDEDGRAQVDLARAHLALAEDDLEGVLAVLLSDDRRSVREASFPDAWLLAGQAFARSGANNEAEPFLLRFLELAPRSADAPVACHLLAQSALARRDVQAARSYRERGEALARWHAYYRARRIQVRANPDDPLPRLGLAQLWLEAHEPARAKEALVELLQRASDYARGWSLLGETERLLDDFPAAQHAWDRALDLDPTLLPARFNRGVLARMQGRAADARADFSWIVEHGAADELRYRQAHLELARLELASGERVRAETLYARYRELGGTDPLE